MDLMQLIKNEAPILIDVALETWGWSLPGAIGLQGTGFGGQFSEARQRRFEDKIWELTSGNLAAPIVTFCTNAERFTGYNLTHRLVALGYTNVRWYRGGTEAWSLSGLPETELAIHDW
jgi:adenylate cyclase